MPRREPFANYVDAFKRGLEEAGYIDGQNVAIEFRWAEGHNDRLGAMAADLASRQAAVIAATGGPLPAFAAKAATATIPIVFAMAGDPVLRGLVASLSRPSGNITGYNLIASELDGKRIGLLHDLVPAARQVAVLLNPKNPNVEGQKQDIEKAARVLALQITILNATSPTELDAVLAKSEQGDAAALLVGTDPFFNSRRAQIVELIAGLALPAIYEWREFVDAGGLMSYGPSLSGAYHQVGVYVGRILKGEKPADLPVMQPVRFELVINLKTAKALGLAVPHSLLAGADEVIE
ncbi:MAG: ABC transporter substrate-binding protein [Acidobacteria bacterium]|nr:ABC transporter substrate-binding protein [Acidobacteriota bacterium]